MTKFSRGLGFIFSFTIIFVIVATLLFYLGMNHLEGRPVTLIGSLEFISQTMTTVGYGQYAPWKTTAMNILVIITQLAGISIVFLSIPIVVTPWLQERIALQAPNKYEGQGEHIIISQYTDLMDTLLDELEQENIPYVLIDERQEVTSDLYRSNYNVIRGDSSEPETLKRARIDEARLAILDGTDERNAMVALAMDEQCPNLRIIAIAGQSKRAEHLSEAGVEKIIYPKDVIGQELARHALKAVTGEIEIKDSDLGGELDIREFPIVPESDLVHKTLREANLRQKFGTHLIGLWRRGKFLNQPSPSLRFRKGDILVATGTLDQLRELEQYAEIGDYSSAPEDKHCVIIGFGNEGKAAYNSLKEAGFEPAILNDVERDGVDVVGNGMDAEALREVGVHEAESVLIAITSDEVAVMVTLMVRRLNPGAEILVQVNQEFAIEPIYRAGANYVQSLTLITGRMLAEEALGEDLLSPALNIKIRRCTARELSGQSVEDLNIGQQFRISIVAVNRDGNLLTEIGPDFTFNEEDDVYMCGTDENVRQFVDFHELS